jgi:hypothetical protein
MEHVGIDIKIWQSSFEVGHDEWYAMYVRLCQTWANSAKGYQSLPKEIFFL